MTIYIMVKLLYLINAASQFFLLSVFVGDGCNLYGMEAIKDLLTGQTVEESPVFPRSSLCSFSVTLSSELVLVLALMVEDTVSSFTSCGEISTSAIPEARGAWPLCKDFSPRLKDLQFKKIIFFGGTRPLVTGFCNFSKAIIDYNFT